MRRIVLLAVVFALLSPSGAAAQRATVTVPLDHSRATGATLALAYERVPATGPRLGTIVLLSGGPGQAALPLKDDFVRILADLRATHDLVLLDQRGTGAGAVPCVLDRLAAVSGCAQRLGALRPLATTSETAADVEDLRVALGVEQLALLGVSYGTQVAAAYARRFPGRTRALILDSPAPQGGFDPFDRLSPRIFGRVLRETCTGRCRSSVGDIDANLRRAVARLPLRGPSVDDDGRARTVTVDELQLLHILRQADFQPMLRAELPAAIASLRLGDAAPLIHAWDLWAPDADETTVVNQARLLATTCIEGTLPWAPDAPLEGRGAAARAALGAGAFAPFSAGVGYEASLVPLCERWPPTPRPAPITEPAPNVPVLVLSGRADTRTPLEQARTIAAEYPRASVVDVAHVGHSVLRNDHTGCARRVVSNFLLGRAAGARCPADGGPWLTAAEYGAPTLGEQPRVIQGPAGRALGVVYATVAAALRDSAAYESWYRVPRTGYRMTGLRSGYLRVRGRRLELHGYETVRGVRLSGRLTPSVTGTLTVSGPATARGAVTFRRGKVTGTLGGRKVRG